MKTFLVHRPLLAFVAALSVWSVPAVVSAQIITDPSPEQAATGIESDSSISAIFRPENGVTINLATLKIFVNDRDVTSQSVITKDFFSYRPPQPLPRGAYQVVLQFNNSQGQPRRIGWGFTVGTTTTAAIASISHNAGNRPLLAGEIMAVTVKGTPGSKVTLFLVQEGKAVQPLPAAQEIAPGTYVSNTLIQESNSTREGTLFARLQSGNQVRFASSERPIRLVVGGRRGQQLGTNVSVSTPVAVPTASLQPQLTNLRDGDRITGSSFTIQGLTTPNAQVRIRVDAATPIGGGFLTASQTIVNDAVVTADSQGVFSYAVRPPVPVPNTTYQINLTGVTPTATSGTVTVRVVQQ